MTAGGLKFTWPLDEDSVTRLRQWFNAFKIVNGEKVVLPLPEDLTLPREAVDGVVRSAEHQYRQKPTSMSPTCHPGSPPICDLRLAI